MANEKRRAEIVEKYRTAGDKAEGAARQAAARGDGSGAQMFQILAHAARSLVPEVEGGEHDEGLGL